MFGSRRPGKRSIVGSRVSARQKDGFFRPAVIKSIVAGGPLQDGDRYTVEFQDGSAVGGLRANEIIGAGFMPLTSDLLQPGQTVFITNNGREVKGVIADSCGDDLGLAGDELLVSICNETMTNGSSVVVHRKVEDIRLIESRRSARLSECQQDSVLPEFTTAECSGKRRTREDDVPFKHSGTKHNHHHFFNDAVMALPCTSGTGSDMDMESETMDEHMAALVLTSLSCSPTSPVFASGFSDCRVFQSEGGSSSTSSGVWTMKSTASSSPSPPKSLLSQSAPATINIPQQSPSSDCIKMEIGRIRRVTYRCTWPGCDQTHDSCRSIEQHIRTEHLLTMSTDTSSRSDESDHEEEFYYTEIEDSEDEETVTTSQIKTETSFQPQSFSLTNGQMLVAPTALDHDYQRKEYRSKPLNIPRASSFHVNDTVPLTLQTTEVPSKTSSSWQPGGLWGRYVVDSAAALSYSCRNDVVSSAGLVSPTSSSKLRKSRGSDVRKCRKVYGIENRSLWCTQCKWKKACTRFLDRHEVN